MVGRAPWLVEEGLEEGYFGPSRQSLVGGYDPFPKSYRVGERSNGRNYRTGI